MLKLNRILKEGLDSLIGEYPLIKYEDILVYDDFITSVKDTKFGLYLQVDGGTPTRISNVDASNGIAIKLTPPDGLVKFYNNDQQISLFVAPIR